MKPFAGPPKPPAPISLVGSLMGSARRSEEEAPAEPKPTSDTPDARSVVPEPAADRQADQPRRERPTEARQRAGSGRARRPEPQAPVERETVPIRFELVDLEVLDEALAQRKREIRRGQLRRHGVDRSGLVRDALRKVYPELYRKARARQPE